MLSKAVCWACLVACSTAPHQGRYKAIQSRLARDKFEGVTGKLAACTVCTLQFWKLPGMDFDMPPKCPTRRLPVVSHTSKCHAIDVDASCFSLAGAVALTYHHSVYHIEVLHPVNEVSTSAVTWCMLLPQLQSSFLALKLTKLTTIYNFALTSILTGSQRGRRSSQHCRYIHSQCHFNAAWFKSLCAEKVQTHPNPLCLAASPFWLRSKVASADTRSQPDSVTSEEMKR